MRNIPLAWLGAAVLMLPVLAQSSGLAPGEFTPAFHPRHVAGPDRNTTTCPV